MSYRADKSQQALKHPWLSGDTATDHNLLPEIRAYMAKARLRRGIEIVKLANRIEALKMQEDEDDEATGDADVPADAKLAAAKELASGIGVATSTDDGAATEGGQNEAKGLPTDTEAGSASGGKKSLSKLAKGAIFREIVMAKVREEKAKEATLQVEKEAQAKEAKRRSFHE